MPRVDIQLNGETRSFEAVATVAQLLDHVGRAGVPCAVEVNQRLVPKSRHAEHPIRDGDRVELVTLVGGG
jgi:sulfur carrier protein